MRRFERLWLAGLLLTTAAYGASPAVEEAQQLVNRGQLEQALKRLDSHLNSSPQDAEARFQRGLVLVRLNRNDEAAKTFSDLTRDYPQLPEPYNNLAVIYAQQGDYDKARDALEAALATHPSYPVAHENLGDLYTALAAAAYNRALSLDPNNASARAKLGLMNQLESLADSGATVAARLPPAAPAAAPAAEGAPAAPAAKVDEAAVARTVQEWAAAWAEKDVGKYLKFYAREFAPEGGTSRESWEAQRKSRIGRPREISVTVSDVKVVPLGDGGAQAVFQQDYKSDLLTNRSTKVLEMVEDDGHWRIRREYTR